MSMTISTTSYLYDLFQNKQVSSSEKSEQTDSAGKNGRTQQSSASASMDRVNLGEEGIAVNEVSRQQGADQSGLQKQSTSPRMDTVEISTEGRAAAASAQEQQTDAVEAYEYEQDLSEYTDAELRQMYYKGEITLQEYEDETGETLEKSGLMG